MKWASLTSAYIHATDKNTPVILNLAAIEQHGPHLPLETDARIGAMFLDELDNRNPEAQLILPAVVMCCSDHHMDFAGTITVPHTVVHDYVLAVLDSVARHGFKNIVLFNSHGGNQAIAQVILERFGAEHRQCRIVLATWWNLARPELAELSDSGRFGTGHACELETSLMLFADAVPDTTKIPAGESFKSGFEWADGSMLVGSKASMFRTMKDISGGNGVVGTPDCASLDKGKQIVELVADRMQQIIADLAAAP